MRYNKYAKKIVEAIYDDPVLSSAVVGYPSKSQ